MAAIERSVQKPSTTPSIAHRTLARLARDLRLVLAELAFRQRYRADLRRLLQTGPHIVADIGLTPDAARREADKPLWRR